MSRSGGEQRRVKLTSDNFVLFTNVGEYHLWSVTGEEGEGMGEISVEIEGDSSGDGKANTEHWGHLRPAAAGVLGFALCRGHCAGTFQ